MPELMQDLCDVARDVLKLNMEERQQLQLQLAFELKNGTISKKSLESVAQACTCLSEGARRFVRITKDVHFSLAGGHEPLRVHACQREFCTVGQKKDTTRLHCELKGACLEQIVNCDMLWVAPEGHDYDPVHV